MTDALNAGHWEVDPQTNTDGKQDTRNFDDPAQSFQASESGGTIIVHDGVGVLCNLWESHS